MSIDDVDKKIDEILLDSTRNTFIFINAKMSEEYPESSIEDAKVSFNADSTSEYLRVLLQLGTKYTQNDYLVSLDKTLNEFLTEIDCISFDHTSHYCVLKTHAFSYQM